MQHSVGQQHGTWQTPTRWWSARPALHVANHFVEYSGYTKTHLQIQKLTYIAHGYMLGIHGVPLVLEEPEAWDHGPVFPTVFRAFKRWGSSVVGKISHSPPPFTADQREVLDNVFAYYGRFCGYFLSDITHGNSREPTPWQQLYRPDVRHIRIDNDVTKEYYRKLYETNKYEY